MKISRRAFIGSLGVGAAAVAFGGVSLLEPASAGTLTVNGAADLAVASSHALQVGDVFTIGGRYAFNPVAMKPTAHLQQFVVTAVTGDTVKMWPKSVDVKAQDVRRAAAWSGLKPLHAK